MQRHQAGMQNLMKSRDKRLNRKLQKQYANRNNWQDRNRNQVELHKIFDIVILGVYIAFRARGCYKIEQGSIDIGKIEFLSCTAFSYCDIFVPFPGQAKSKEKCMP